MIKLRKCTAFVLTLAILSNMVACGSKNDDIELQAESGTESELTEEEINFAKRFEEYKDTYFQERCDCYASGDINDLLSNDRSSSRKDLLEKHMQDLEEYGNKLDELSSYLENNSRGEDNAMDSEKAIQFLEKFNELEYPDLGVSSRAEGTSYAIEDLIKTEEKIKKQNEEIDSAAYDVNEFTQCKEKNEFVVGTSEMIEKGVNVYHTAVPIDRLTAFLNSSNRGGDGTRAGGIAVEEEEPSSDDKKSDSKDKKEQKNNNSSNNSNSNSNSNSNNNSNSTNKENSSAKNGSSAIGDLASALSTGGLSTIANAVGSTITGIANCVGQIFAAKYAYKAAAKQAQAQIEVAKINAQSVLDQANLKAKHEKEMQELQNNQELKLDEQKFQHELALLKEKNQHEIAICKLNHEIEMDCLNQYTGKMLAIAQLNKSDGIIQTMLSSLNNAWGRSNTNNTAARSGDTGATNVFSEALARGDDSTNSKADSTAHLKNLEIQVKFRSGETDTVTLGANKITTGDTSWALVSIMKDDSGDTIKDIVITPMVVGDKLEPSYEIADNKNPQAA